MTTPDSETLSGMPARDESRWHYRRSLASRVILLTTMAVGLAVALVALGAYVTVKMSLESSLDSSLRDRAHRAATSIQIARLTNEQVPSWATGAADVRIFLVSSDGTAITTDKSGPRIPLDSQRDLRRPGHEQEQRAHRVLLGQRLPRGRRTLRRQRLRPGARPEHGAAGAGPAEDGRGHAALRPRRRDRRGGGGLGRGAQRVATRTPPDPQRRGDRPDGGPHPAPGRGRRRDRPPRDGVQRHARRPGWVARPPAPARRRRRARAADADHVAAHQPRPAAPGRRGRRPRPESEGRAARRRRGPDRGDVDPGRRPRGAGPRRAADRRRRAGRPGRGRRAGRGARTPSPHGLDHRRRSPSPGG